ncbi:MAG: hypothetical protein WBW48_19295, partial [Anaerolineae bacterium]
MSWRWRRIAEQVYDALSYYYEHIVEIEQAIALNSERGILARMAKREVTAQPEGIVVIARSTATKQSQPMAQGDCFASLAMTVEPNSTF